MMGRIRDWRPFFAIAVITGAALWLLYAGWESDHLAVYGAFAVPLVVLALGWIAWVWHLRTGRVGRATAGQELDHVADLLAVAVKGQWERAAGERRLLGAEPIPVTWGSPSLPLAGPVAAATGSRRFAPLPGLAPTGETQLAAGQLTDLHAVYGGLGSGRLVIAGAPGSGKSGAAVLLVLAALEHREQVPAQDRPKVPVPLLFTVQDWDPHRQPVRDWLTKRMQETYPLLAGKTGEASADSLIAAGKIAVILDGLDEIARDLRPVAVQALSEQASFRVVVLSRTAEMASAASKLGVLQGAAAIELRVIDADTAADYLERVQLDPPPDGWRDLIDRIRGKPRSPLANALDSPLTLSLVRDTYQSGDDAHELLEFCDTTQQHVSGGQATEQITGHLLDRVLPAAYAHRPGQQPPRYDALTAQKAFAEIAAAMNQDGTRDLQWWRIHAWAPPAPRSIAGGLVVGLVVGLAVGLAAGLAAGIVPGLVAGLAAGLVVGLISGLAGEGDADPPRKIGRPRLRVLAQEMLAAGNPFTIVDTDAIFDALDDPDAIRSTSPVASWRNDRNYAIVFGLLFGLMLGLPYWFILWSLVGPGGAVAGLAVGLMLVLSGSQVWPSSLAAAQLARRWHTPAQLMRFLDEARDRNVLRTVGPVYQFRHALLQDRLAAASSKNDGDATKQRSSKAGVTSSG